MISLSRQQALTTAERLLNPEEVLAAVPAGGSLSGLAGTALLHARLATVDPVFAQAALAPLGCGPPEPRSLPWRCGHLRQPRRTGGIAHPRVGVPA
jgi:hypothetical protein